jgi:hypothetical protein
MNSRRWIYRFLGLALLLAMLLAGWMAWQSRGGMAQLQGESIAGWTIDSVQVESVESGRLMFDQLQLSQDGQGGSRIELELQGVQVDFSLFKRHVDLLQVRQAKAVWRAGQASDPQPWPRLLESLLPLTELRIERLQASVELGQGRRWQIETPLQLQQQSDGRLLMAAEIDRQPLQLLVTPGTEVKAELHWPYKSDQPAVVDLYVTYAKSSSPLNQVIKTKPKVEIQGKFPLKLATPIGKWLLPTTELPRGDGILNFKALLELGPYTGQWTSLDAQLQADQAQLEWGAASNPTRIQLNGPASLQLRPGKTGIEWSTTLQPALKWKISAGREPAWTAASTLKQAWRIAPGPQRYSASLPFELQLKGRQEPLALTLDRLQLDLARNASLRSANGQLRLAATQLHADWPAAALETQWRVQDQKLALTGQLLLQGQPLLKLSGDYGLTSSCGQGRLDYAGSLATLDRLLQPRPKNLQLLRLKAGAGSGWLAGQLCLRPGKAVEPVVTGQWQLKQAEIGWDKALAKGLDLDLTLRAIAPLAGSLALKLETASLAGGLALAPASLELDWTDRLLQLHRFDAGLLDGKLSAEKVKLELPASPGQISWQIPLNVSQIDLERLLTILDVPGLSGNGRLSGQLPLVWTAAGVEIRNGQLSSQQAGQLRYVSTVPVTDNPGLQALRDFRYSQFGLDLDYQADGKYAVNMRLDGNNPEFYRGHPIAFKLKLDGALPGLFKGALLSGDFDAYILKQLQQGILE